LGGARHDPLFHVVVPTPLPALNANGAERAFETIGFRTKPRALLIGFGTKSDSWPICIEPEYRFFQPEHLEGVRTRAEDLYGSHPRSSLMHSDARLHERYHQVLRDRCRADALVEALEMHSPEPISYFAGISSRVGDYEVHPVIGVPVHAIGVVPQLTTEEVDERPAVRSLVHSCIDLLLGLSRQALYQPEAGDSLDVLGVSAEELVRRAATNLVTSAARSTGSLFGNSIFSSLVAVSTTRYEGATRIRQLDSASSHRTALTGVGTRQRRRAPQHAISQWTWVDRRLRRRDNPSGASRRCSSDAHWFSAASSIPQCERDFYSRGDARRIQGASRPANEGGDKSGDGSQPRELRSDDR
jgi:hypothetical protein